MGQNIGTGGRAWGRILGRCEVYTGVPIGSAYSEKEAPWGLVVTDVLT